MSSQKAFRELTEGRTASVRSQEPTTIYTTRLAATQPAVRCPNPYPLSMVQSIKHAAIMHGPGAVACAWACARGLLCMCAWACARALLLQWRDCRVHHVRRGGQVREEEGGQLGEERRPGEEGRPCEEGRPGEERPGEEGTILVVVLALTVALVATRVAGNSVGTTSPGDNEVPGGQGSPRPRK